MKQILFLSFTLIVCLKSSSQGMFERSHKFKITFDDNTSVLVDTTSSNCRVLYNVISNHKVSQLVDTTSLIACGFPMTFNEINKIKKLQIDIPNSKIVSYTVYFTGKGFSENPGIAFCKGDTMNNDIKRIFQRVSSGTIVVFDEIKVVDEEGHTINVKSLPIRIIE